MMSFLKKEIKKQGNYKQVSKYVSLQAHPRIFTHNPLLCSEFKAISKRMSSFFFCRIKAGITIEAAFALPFFLFFMINLLSVILCFQNFSVNLSSMHQKGKELSVYAHAAEDGKELSNDLVILTKVIPISSLIPVISFPEARTIVNCRIRKWTGYDVMHASDTEEEEEWVYITASGSVYHRDRGCSYLNPSLHVDGVQTIAGRRNADGEKYRACEICAGKGTLGIVYYTEYGNRYHASLQCSGLKRTIQTVRISETGGRHACSKCAQ